jgi:MFS family permease
MAMSISANAAAASVPRSDRLTVDAWVHVVVAGLAMVATLPGRTHGLGLVTEPLLRDLHLDRVQYGAINLFATLLGSFFCLPCGWLIDRLGPRVVLASLLLGLGGVVVVMSQVQPDWWVLTFPRPGSDEVLTLALGLLLLVLLTRGLGQSALSVVSLALIGKSAGRHSGLAYGVYSFVIALGFMAAFAGCKAVLEQQADWRYLWMGIGLVLVSSALPAALLVRPFTPTVQPPALEDENPTPAEGASLTLGQALRTPTFWVFATGTSVYGLIAAGVSLFNQSILEERHFDRNVFLTITTLTPMIGLASNLGTGWLATRWQLGRLLAVALLGLGAALAAFPLVRELWQVYAYAVTMGVVGGMVTVIFFAVWARAFGKAHLGKIQGAAQMMTVVASAFGPLLLGASKDAWGSYVPLFYSFAPVVAVLGVAAWFTPAGESVATQLRQGGN